MYLLFFIVEEGEKNVEEFHHLFHYIYRAVIYIYFCLCKACTGKRNAIGKFPSKSMPRRGAETCSIIQAAMTSEVCVSVIFLGSCDVIFG